MQAVINIKFIATDGDTIDEVTMVRSLDDLATGEAVVAAKVVLEYDEETEEADIVRHETTVE